MNRFLLTDRHIPRNIFDPSTQNYNHEKENAVSARVKDYLAPAFSVILAHAFAQQQGAAGCLYPNMPLIASIIGERIGKYIDVNQVGAGTIDRPKQQPSVATIGRSAASPTMLINRCSCGGEKGW